MNDVYTKDALVLRLSVDHKNLSTEVTAEARHTQRSEVSKYEILHSFFQSNRNPKEWKVKRKDSTIKGKVEQ